MITIRDRVIGMLLGLASGDRIGGPLRMALCLSKSLIDKQGFDEADVFEKYKEWYFDGGFDTGPTASGVFKYVSWGMSISEAVQQVDKIASGMTAGCNPMHRALVLALSADIADDDLDKIARQEAKLTHYHPLAGEVSASTVLLCRKLIRGMSITDVVSEIEPYSWRSRPHSNGGFAPDVFNSTLYFLTEYNSFETTLLNSLGFAGANNYCPVVVGALAGAFYGQSNIPNKFISHCKILDQVSSIANAFAMQWNED